jgi:hypothetical protein
MLAISMVIHRSRKCDLCFPILCCGEQRGSLSVDTRQPFQDEKAAKRAYSKTRDRSLLKVLLFHAVRPRKCEWIRMPRGLNLHVKTYDRHALSTLVMYRQST